MTNHLSITVIGGVYAETVRSPRRYEIYGSGGRAAATLSLLGANVTLTTALDKEAARLFKPVADTFGFDLKAAEIPATTEFIYDHPLGPPRTRPLRIESIEPWALTAETENALVFGMLEGDPKVKARRIVYDPQSPISPKWLEETGSTADEVVYILNRREGNLLTGKDDPDSIVRSILSRPGVSSCALKLGPHGAMVGDSKGELAHIPCYRTEHVWPIGSGDIFAATLTWGLFEQQLSPVRAAEVASKSVALYANSGAIPGHRDLILGTNDFPFRAVTPSRNNRATIYLAGPFFTLQDRWLIEETRDALNSFGFRVFSPLHDVGEGEAEVVAPQDLKALSQSNLVFALLEGLDPGTLFEVGFARALNIPVVAHIGQAPSPHLKMMSGSQCTLETDYTTALYKTAWSALES